MDNVIGIGICGLVGIAIKILLAYAAQLDAHGVALATLLERSAQMSVAQNQERDDRKAGDLAIISTLQPQLNALNQRIDTIEKGGRNGR